MIIDNDTESNSESIVMTCSRKSPRGWRRAHLHSTSRREAPGFIGQTVLSVRL